MQVESAPTQGTQSPALGEQGAQPWYLSGEGVKLGLGGGKPAFQWCGGGR